MSEEWKVQFKIMGALLAVLSIMAGLIILVASMFVPTKAPPQPKPDIVCWQDRLVFLHNYSAFDADPIEEAHLYKTTDTYTAPYGIIEVVYHTTDKDVVIQGPRFFAYDALQFWDRTYSKYHRCPYRDGHDN